MMAALLYLKHAYNLSDDGVIERWAQDVYFQFFSGQEYFEARFPCDKAQLSRFCKGLSEAGVERLLKTTIEASVALGAFKKTDLERVIVDTTVQEKAIAYPTDSRLLEVARANIVRLAQRAGIKLELIHEQGMIIGARTFPGNPYDGHTLAEQVEQATNLLQNLKVKPTTAIVDLGYRGVDRLVPAQIIHSGRFKTLSAQQRRWLKRRQAVEPVIEHLKADHRMDKCWLKGSEGSALHTVLCAAGFNLRWLLRAIARYGLKAVYLCLIWVAAIVAIAVKWATGHRQNGSLQLAQAVG
jgi:hypothetical protein